MFAVRKIIAITPKPECVGSAIRLVSASRVLTFAHWQREVQQAKILFVDATARHIVMRAMQRLREKMSLMLESVGPILPSSNRY